MTKKNFKESPAQFLVSQDKASKEKKTAGTGTTGTQNKTPKRKEKKTARFNMLLKPSYMEALQEYSDKTGYSMNEVLNEALKEFLGL